MRVRGGDGVKMGGRGRVWVRVNWQSRQRVNVCRRDRVRDRMGFRKANRLWVSI